MLQNVQAPVIFIRDHAEFQLLSGDGDQFFPLLRSHQIEFSPGVPQYIDHEGKNYFIQCSRSPKNSVEIIFIWNITEYKKSEERAQLLEQAIESLNDGISITDSQGHTVFVNRAYENLLECSRDTLIGEHIFHFISAGLIKLPLELEVLNTEQTMTSIQRVGSGKLISTTCVPIPGQQAVVSSLKDVASLVEIYNQLKGIKQDDNGGIDIDRVVSRSPKMNHVINLAMQMAAVDVSVLLRGETGSGKDVVAQVIHNNGTRKGHPYIKVNCGAIPEQLFESELFGYEKGAFTGATAKKLGFLELANHGTLFLDEIGEMPLHMQVKLLTAIQDKCFYRVGGMRPINVDVRIIAATNCDLEEMVQKGTFREDLFYRLNVISIHVPPLRDRKEDIVPLSLFFLKDNNFKYNKKKLIMPDTYNALRAYTWPGNVRELQNLIEQLVLLSKHDLISCVDLPEKISSYYYEEEREPAIRKADTITSLKEAKEAFYGSIIRRMFHQYPSSYKLAKRLQISQSSASRLIRKYIGPADGV